MRLTSLEPVLQALADSRGADPIHDTNEFGAALALLAKAKPNGFVLSSRSATGGLSTALAVALLYRVPDDVLRDHCAALINNGSSESCAVGPVALIKSPCFSADFACFIDRRGIFQGFDDEQWRAESVLRAELTPRPRSNILPVNFAGTKRHRDAWAAGVVSGEALIVASGGAALMCGD